MAVANPGPVWMRLENRSAAPALASDVRHGLVLSLVALAELNRDSVDYEPGAANAEQLDELVALAKAIAAGLDEVAARSE